MCYGIRQSFRRRKAVISLLVLFMSLASPCAADPSFPGIRVELNRAKGLSLHVTLGSGSATTVRFSYSRLPWASGDSMVIVAAVAGGRCLRRDLPVGDPMLHEIALEPGGSLSGDIDLEKLFPDIRNTLKQSDVQLFWAYEAPQALQIPRWSGGWILVPEEK